MTKWDIRFAAPKAPRGQHVLFPQRLDEVIAGDAPVRVLVALLEEVDWSMWEKAYTGTGQPPIHPRYLAGAILWGLLNRMRSSRVLERAAHKDLDFIWLLEGFTPDHSTFAEFRTRHAEAIKELQVHFARALVNRREKALLHLIIDGTRLRADSNRQGARTAQTIEYIIGELDRRMEALKQGDRAAEQAVQAEHLEVIEPLEDAAENLVSLDEEIARLEAKRAKYQKALDIARERDEQARKHSGKSAKPVRVPVTDPESQMLPNKEGGFGPNYTPMATVESQTGAIVHANVLVNSDEAGAVMPAVAAAEALTGEKVGAVLADSNFAAGPVLEALAENGTEAYMPTRSASKSDNPAPRPDPSVPVAEEDRNRLPRTGGQFSRAAFVYDAQADAYYCPMGEKLAPYKRGTSRNGAQSTYYTTKACANCPLASECIKGKGGARSITRDEHENLREAADQRMATPEGEKIYKQRSPGIEGVFGVLKGNMGIRRFTLRGLQKVRTEWNWICSAYNLKKLLAMEARSASGGPGNENYPRTSGKIEETGHKTLPFWAIYVHKARRTTTRRHRTSQWKTRFTATAA
jgi:transposase